MSVLSQLDKPVSFCSASDRELLSKVQRGDGQAVEELIAKYEHIVYKKAVHYFLIGSDRDDVVQEGLIGLYKAICDYDESKRASFRSFAELCVTRQIISSIKSATRLKHTPLNTYVSIYKPASEEDSERTLLETIENDQITEPLVWVEQQEHVSAVRLQLMKTLTKLEWKVFDCYLQGHSYEEISKRIGKHEKSIDNALQRIKRKVSRLTERNELLCAE